jgi:Flp pilus assembly protein TadB
MAQPKNKRRRKRRGTQGGKIDAGGRRSRPRSREEARQRARSGGGSSRSTAKKKDLPPTWKSSALRGVFAAVIFIVILLALFKRPIGVSLAFGAFMLVFYIPTGYYIDLTMWRKRERQRIRDREGTA